MTETYQGKPCPYGHDGLRYRSNRKCVGCAKPKTISEKERARQNRAAAIERGDLFYEGRQCSKGHGTKRRVCTRMCVVCELERDEAQRGTQGYKDRQKRYYERHKEQCQAKNRELLRLYRVKRSETFWKREAQIAEWRSQNPEKVRAYRKNYQFRRRSWQADGVTTEELTIWARSQNKVCYWCGHDCRDEYHIDHYIPLSGGGEHSLDNLVIACPSCNIRKNAKDPYEFAQEWGRLF